MLQVKLHPSLEDTVVKGTVVTAQPTPEWNLVTNDWFKIIFPLASRQSFTQWNEIQTFEEAIVTKETLVWLRKFDEWLDSLPRVPYIPLEALRREYLY